MEDNITEINCQSLVIEGNVGNVKIQYKPQNQRVSIQAHDVMALTKNNTRNLASTVQGKLFYIDTVPGEEIILLAKISNFYSKFCYKAIINDAKTITLFTNIHFINDTGRKIVADNVVIKSFGEKNEMSQEENQRTMAKMASSMTPRTITTTINDDQLVFLKLGNRTFIPNVEYVIPLENITMISKGLYFVHHVGSQTVDCIEDVSVTDKIMEGEIEFYDKNMIPMSSGRIEATPGPGSSGSTTTMIHHYENKSITVIDSVIGEVEAVIIVQNNTGYNMKFVYICPRMKKVKNSIILKPNQRQEIREKLVYKQNNQVISD